MTVEELIEQLSKLPSTAKVYKEYYKEDDSCCGGEYYEDLIENVTFREFFTNRKQNKKVQNVILS